MAFDDLDGRKTTLSRTKDGVFVQKRFQLTAVDVVAAYADANIPARGDPLVYAADGTSYASDVTIEELFDRRDNTAADGSNSQFTVDLQWEPRSSKKNPVADTASFHFRNQPVMVHINHVIDADGTTSDHYPNPDTDGSETLVTSAINVNSEGVAEGADIEVTQTVLIIEHWLEPGETEAYLDVIKTLKDKVNDAAFSGLWGTWAKGEARYRSFDLTHVNDEVDQISHEIVYEPNVTIDVPLDFTDGTASVVKEGHRYFWVRSGKLRADTDGTSTTKTGTLDAHVNSVYEYGNFALLDLPEFI